MNTMLLLTQRVFNPRFFLFVYFFFDVNARPLMLKSGKLLQLKDKETLFPLLSISHSLTTDHLGKHDSTSFGVSSIIDTFQRPLSLNSRENNELSSTDSERKCKQNTTKRRQRRYVLHGSKMKKLDIKWAIAVYSMKMSFSKQKIVLEKAFRTWADQCRLSFMYTTDTSKADIVIKFLTGDHGDQQKFDDAGSLKAHSYFPAYGSTMHFDDYENWVADASGKGGVSLLSVAIHEIGHSLGLRHSSVKSAVMFPVLQNGRNTLDKDDIKGIQAMYGGCTVQKVDAVVTGIKYGSRDTALVFKNEWVWDVELSTGNIKSGYPKKTANYFNGVLTGKNPFKTVFYERDYNTYVFMFGRGYTILDDSLYFPASGNDINVQYTYRYSYYPFLKSAPDAAFVDPKNPAIYHFFLGSQYYVFNTYSYHVLTGFPKAISSVWPGLPDNLDTAYYNYEKSAYYFIKGNEYFTSDPVSGVYYPAGVLSDIFRNICPI